MDFPCCFDCRFFVPEGERINDLRDDELDACTEGECRVPLPVMGQLLTDRHGNTFRGFAEWPRVLSSDWCSKLEPRKKPEPACAAVGVPAENES